MLCPIKVNSNTIELAVHTSCYCILDLLCATMINRAFTNYLCHIHSINVFHLFSVLWQTLATSFTVLFPQMWPVTTTLAFSSTIIEPTLKPSSLLACMAMRWKWRIYSQSIMPSRCFLQAVQSQLERRLPTQNCKKINKNIQQAQLDFFVQLVLCPAIRLGNLVESQTL